MSSTEPTTWDVEKHAAPYVRQRPTHRSVEPIDDLASETGGPELDDQGSDRAVAGGVLPTLGHRRSRAEGVQLRRDLHYGQYLEIPNGRRARRRPFKQRYCRTSEGDRPAAPSW